MKKIESGALESAQSTPSAENRRNTCSWQLFFMSWQRWLKGQEALLRNRCGDGLEAVCRKSRFDDHLPEGELRSDGQKLLNQR